MTITARFPSTCPSCSGPIIPGAQVHWEKGQKARHVSSPPIWAIDLALTQAQLSPCAKSKRGAVAFVHDNDGRELRGLGHNGPALGLCDGSDACRASCGKRCVHAEMRAIRTSARGADVVHVKIDEHGKLVAGGGPSCWQCSREILDAGCKGVWLFEEMPEEWCPHRDVAGVDCPMCQGDECMRCYPSIGMPICFCDELERHWKLPIISARWRYYTAADFHRTTMLASDVYNPGGAR